MHGQQNININANYCDNYCCENGKISDVEKNIYAARLYKQNQVF